jgi:hypothetical protein
MKKPLKEHFIIFLSLYVIGCILLYFILTYVSDKSVEIKVREIGTANKYPSVTQIDQTTFEIEFSYRSTASGRTDYFNSRNYELISLIITPSGNRVYVVKSSQTVENSP